MEVHLRSADGLPIEQRKLEVQVQVAAVDALGAEHVVAAPARNGDLGERRGTQQHKRGGQRARPHRAPPGAVGLGLVGRAKSASARSVRRSTSAQRTMILAWPSTVTEADWSPYTTAMAWPRRLQSAWLGWPVLASTVSAVGLADGVGIRFRADRGLEHSALLTGAGPRSAAPSDPLTLGQLGPLGPPAGR